MTPEQVNLITQSFDRWPIRRDFAAKFYNRFFETTPDARRLFPDDMERLHLKLMDTMAAIVGALNNDTLCRSIISHTARQHRRIGVTSSQLAAFGDALVSVFTAINPHMIVADDQPEHCRHYQWCPHVRRAKVHVG